MKTYLGIEIGNQRIKFAICTEDGVKQFLIEELPEDLVKDGSIQSWEGMATFIKEIKKKHRITCKEVAMILPESTTYVRRFMVPYMTVDQLRFNLPYEFHDFITADKESYFYDYAVMGIVEEEQEGRGAKNIDLMAVAVSKDTIDKYKNMLKRCGLKLKVAAPTACAYQNLVRKHKQESLSIKNGDYAILDIGHKTVNLRIFIDGKYETGREIEPGLEALNGVIANALSVDEQTAESYKRNNQNEILYSEECMSFYNQITLEVIRVITFFTYNYPNNTLDTLYCCGGGAKIEPLLETLRDSLELKVKGLNELFLESRGNEEALVLGAAAVGITWN